MQNGKEIYILFCPVGKAILIYGSAYGPEMNRSYFSVFKTEADSITETLCSNYYLTELWYEGGSPNSAMN
jgi:hypothetical protein